MSVDRENTQSDSSILERLQHSLISLIFLDLITLGLYSAARNYLVHAELSEKKGRRPFSPAFLHILIMLHLLLWVLRFSRESLPWDSAVVMTRLGAGLLSISLLLVFRRTLVRDLHLKIGVWPLALFGFWYLQHVMNQREENAVPHETSEAWPRILGVILLSVSLSLALGTLRHFRVANPGMEPTLLAGDYVLADQFTLLWKDEPRRGELLVYQAVRDAKRVQVRRILGRPGDRLSFHGDSITINGEVLGCTPVGEEQPGPDAMDQTRKRLFQCEVEGQSFRLHRYKEGPLTAVQGVFEVPPGHYFMIGDNLDNCLDSRTVGPIPIQNILGYARLRTISYRLGDSLLWRRWFHWL